MKRLRDVITLRDIIKIIMTNSNPNIEHYPSILKDWEKNDFQGSVERLKTRETVRQLISWMEAAFPDVVKVMVHERDALMVKRLRACEGKVVGVVGMAHMDGIERLWKDADS
jgi:pheromone shutdown protein TraB